VALHVQDVYAQFPPQMLGTFDVVHIQKLITIVFNNDPVPLIQNVMKLLSKSIIVSPPTAICSLFTHWSRTGRIYTMEWDRSGIGIHRPFRIVCWEGERDTRNARFHDFPWDCKIHGVSIPYALWILARTSQRYAKWLTDRSHFCSWISKLDSILAAQGFETTIYDRAPIALEDRAAWNVGFLLTYEDAMTRAKRLDMKSLRLRLDKLHGELQQDVFLQPEIVLAVARKLEC